MRPMIVLPLILSAGLILSACAKNVTPAATGGSRSDGIVNMSFEIGQMQKAVINWSQTDAGAVARCQAWGYTGANRFGGYTRKCQWSNQYGCARWFVTVPYQCTGKR